MSSSPQNPARGGYRPEIDGLRALAILSVVLYHAGFSLCRGGFAGVDVFFVISGYLIGGQIYVETTERRFRYVAFYARRARRILPALFLVLAAVLATGLLLLSPAELRDAGRAALATALSASNVLFWKKAGYFAPATELNPLLMTWSLGIEEQFYLLVPLLMGLLLRLRRGWHGPALGSFCALSFVLSCLYLHSNPMAVFYLLPGRAWELGVGVLCAVLAHGELSGIRRAGGRDWLPAAGLLLTLLPMGIISRATLFPGPAALPTVFGTALLISTSGGLVHRRLLSWSPLCFVGRISYSWYLWHWPMLAYLRLLTGGELSRTAALAALAVSFAASVVSYRLVEQPLRHSRTPAVTLLLRYAALSAALMAFAAYLWLGDGVPQRNPRLAAVEREATAGLEDDPCLLEPKYSQPRVSVDCFERRPHMVALWGDSHAAAIAPALRGLAHRNGYGLWEAAKSSCPPLLAGEQLMLRDSEHTRQCSAFNEHTAERILGDPAIEVVAIEATWARLLAEFDEANPAAREDEGERLLEATLRHTIDRLRAAGKHVILFEDAPFFERDPLLRVRAAAIPARRAYLALRGEQADPGSAPTALRGEVAEFHRIAQSLDGHGVQVYDLKAAICPQADSGCAYRIGDELLFMDPHHFSRRGAQLALERLTLPAAR
jgi:peptidoglycan/LPS O-acetylase OafA/YrhL